MHAVVTNECQQGAIGDDALWPPLAEAARPIRPALGRLVAGARAAGVAVAHCVAVRRADLRAVSTNAPLLEVSARRASLVEGTPAAALIDELGPEPSDLVFRKTHGLASLRTTGADSALRNLGVDTVVLAGVSLNVAIPALAFEAVNLGYRVIVARDAVAGVPSDYAAAVLDRSLSLVATLSTVDELIERWNG